MEERRGEGQRGGKDRIGSQRKRGGTTKDPEMESRGKRAEG